MVEDDYSIDRTVVTDQFLIDLSNAAEKKKLGILPLGREAAEEAYINFRDRMNKKMISEGMPPLTDLDIMERGNIDEAHYERLICGILFFYSSKKFDEAWDRSGLPKPEHLR